jgi:hypothetical protein
MKQHQHNTVSDPDEIDLMTSLSVFARVVYDDLMTVVLVSLLTALTALPVVTIGASLLACCETMTAVVTGEGRGGPSTERQRVSLYCESFRRHLRRGLMYSLLLILVFITTVSYVALAYSIRAEGFLLGAILGLYAIVLVLVWTFRAGSVLIRIEDQMGFFAAMREGAYIALSDPAYSTLHVVVAGFFVLFMAVFGIAIPLLLPGVLAVLEVVMFEELAGEGAGTVLARYQGEVA